MELHELCVHCLKPSTTLTKDHVFPKSWYPDSTPSTVDRWTVPACGACNAEHGKNEQSLLLRLGICFGPNEMRAQGVADKALRMINPNLARSSRDRAARTKARQELRSEIVVHERPPGSGVYPGLGMQPGVDYREFPTIRISQKSTEMLGAKLVRGLEYKLKRQFVEADRMIQIFANDDEDVRELLASLRTHGETHHRGPGITVTRAEAVDEPLAAMYHFEIWGRFKMNAVVMPMATPALASRRS